MTDSIRPTAVAGLFYPADAGELRQQIESYLQIGRTISIPDRPQAIVTPHAGYIYSGPTAGIAWAATETPGAEIQRVLLLGPSHRVALHGMATSPASHWQTPLGNIALDQQAAQQLQLLPYVNSTALAHAAEHSLEVQVPFIQRLFPHTKLLPLVVGEASPEDVARALRPYWQDTHTLIAVSSDLSHYHDYATAQRLDRTTSQAIECFDLSAIGPEQACGCRALCGLLTLAAEDNRVVTTLDLRNSGDTAGDKQRVVGYGAYTVQ